MKILIRRSIGNSVILAMSDSLQSIRSDLTSHSATLIQHLAKIYLYPGTEYIAHWVEEVWNAAGTVAMRKGSNKYPNAQFIYDALWLSKCDILDNLIRHARYACADIDTWSDDDIDADAIRPVFERYFDWLSQELSEHGMVSPMAVRSALIRTGILQSW